MSFSFKADNELITAIRDRAMFNTFAGNQSYVIKDIGDELAVTVTPSTLNVSVGSGEAVICGGSTIIDSDNSLTLGANESGYLVIRIDLSQTQENICQFLKVPQLIQQNINNGTDLIYDLPLYQYATNTSTVTSLVDVRSIRDYADTSLDGGTQGQVLTKISNNNGDYGWQNTDYMEVDTLGTYDSATPINADQLEGHPASYFQQALTAGTGIDISNNTVNNYYRPLSTPNLNDIKYRFIGYVFTSTNYPTGANANGMLMAIPSNNTTSAHIYQQYAPYNSNDIYTRRYNANSSTWTSWRQLSDCYMAGDTLSFVAGTGGRKTPTLTGLVVNTTSFAFFTPLSKPINATSISFSSMQLYVRGIAGNILNNVNVITASGYSVVSEINEGGIQITITTPSAMSNVTALTPITVSMNATGTFA